MEIARRALLMAGIAACVPLPAFAGAAVAEPLVVLISLPVWSPDMGLESPDFVLYADGTAIYRHGEGFRTVRLEPSERDALVGELNIPVQAGLARHYEAESWTDGSNVTLYLYGADSPQTLSVYGDPSIARVREKLPPPVVAAYDRLAHFDRPDAVAWMPERIEVVLGLYDPVPEGAPLAWPRGWPGLGDPRTVHWKDGRYSLYLPARDLPALDRLFARKAPGQPISIDGKSWGLMPRIPFPGEARWLKRERA